VETTTALVTITKENALEVFTGENDFYKGLAVLK